MFKSPTQPYCRMCGKKIAKARITVYFGQSVEQRGTLLYQRTEKPTSKEEVKSLFKEQVSLTRWCGAGAVSRNNGVRWISTAFIWDGESYKDAYFCTDDHAKEMGYAAARGGQHTAAWAQATRNAKQESMDASPIERHRHSAN